MSHSAEPTVPSELVDGLNEPQAAAVRALLGPVLVVAGPGSGKTRVLTHRAAALVRTNLAFPSQILAVTFTNKAAGEMRERLVQLLGEDDVSRMWVTTFHAMCARVLRIEHSSAGLPKAFTILDASDVRTVLKGVLEDLGWAYDASELRGFASEISRFKNGGRVRPDRRLPVVLEAYTAALNRLAALDFDDLLLRTAQLLESDPQVLERLRARFRFVLVDEFQDTNPVQYRLVQLLAEQHRNICVVGDADQSIYGFRSATPEALHLFTQEWPESRMIVLEQNYRSSAAIVETCRALIDVNESPFRPQLFTSNQDGEQVRVVVCDDDRDEATFIASELASRRVDQTSAILLRTNAQSRQFEEALIRARLPYAMVGALRFYERAEVKDALAYLRLVVNPQDALALSRIVTAPRRGLGPKAVADVVSLAGDLTGPERGSLRCAIALAGERGTKVGAAWRAVDELLTRVYEAAMEQGPAEALKLVIDGGLRDFVAKSGEGAQDKIGNLEELVSAARLFAQLPDPTSPEGLRPQHLPPAEQTEAFLASVALVTASDDEQPDADRGMPVQVMTAHASKGKEFDIVYVCGVEENLFPHARGGEVSSEDEERRLLFVACSRARHRLTLSRAQRRMTFGRATENPPSRFLADLPSTVRTVMRARNVTSRPWGWSDRPSAVPAASTAPRSAIRPPRPAAGPRLSLEDAVAGTRVRHGTFGVGQIVEVTGAGADLTVTVRFPDTSRMLKVALAPLEVAAGD